MDSNQFAKSLCLIKKNLPRIEEDFNSLDGETLTYSELDNEFDPHNLDCIKAINAERNLCLYQIPLMEDSFFEGDVETIFADRMRANLAFDLNGCFCIIFEVSVTIPQNMEITEALSVISKDRGFFKNLRLRKIVNDLRENAQRKISESIFFETEKNKSIRIKFTDDFTLPILICSSVDNERVKKLFINEELFNSINAQNGLSGAYQGAFFHPGWNYTVVAGFPLEVTIKILQMMLATQFYFINLTQLSHRPKRRNSLISH